MQGVINLSKGGMINLSKSGLKEARVGLGWKVAETGVEFDLDASLFLLKRNNKVGGAEDFIFYWNLVDKYGAIEHKGDNLTGGDGATDDEEIIIDFTKIPEDYTAIDIAVTIHGAEKKGQTFGQVREAYLRVVDPTSGVEKVRYNLATDFSVETSVIMVRFERNGVDWEMKAVGEGLRGDLADVAARYGIQAGYN